MIIHIIERLGIASIMAKALLVFSILVVGIAVNLGDAPPEKCERNWKKVGCYHDRIVPNRPLPEEILNHRDPTNKNWDGHMIDWKQWPQSLHALACKCAELARQRGMKYFGLQFFGECWVDPSTSDGSTPKFYRDGPSDKCIGVDYKPCVDSTETECVGKPMTNYIYMLEEESKTEEKIPGNWGDWSSWSPCSATCNGGKRARERICNNPAPKNGGEFCKGEEEGTEECNTEACEPVCKNILEVGFILDSSTSVTKANWDRTLDFVKRFTKEFAVSDEGVHFGVIRFEWKAHLDFTMGNKSFYNPAALREKINSLEYLYGGTRTDLALELAQKKFFCNECGIRLNVPKLLIVITDGKSSSNSKPMPEATAMLKKMKVNIITIGVGEKIDIEELQEIATDESNVFLLQGYQYLEDKINKILKLSCQAKNL